MSIEKDNLLEKRKFNSSQPFPHDLPYQEFYAEKVPLLNVFRMVLGEFANRKCYGRNIFEKMLRLASPFFTGEKFVAVECGVYKGNSLIACAEIARDFGLPFHFYGLDTFKGLPALSKTDRKFAPQNALYLKKSLFADTSLEEVQEKIQKKSLESYVTLIPGLFKNTLPQLSEGKFWFVSVDCDLYEPHRECLEFFYPRMEQRGIIFFDDYHSIEYPMARLAIDRFLVGKTESLLHLRYGNDKPNHTKAFIVKT
jgi:hypothetical protein